MNINIKCNHEEVPGEQINDQLDEFIEDYRKKPGGLIPILQIAQGIYGYLPEAVLKHIAKKFKVSYTEVAGVVSFYSFFSLQPRGKFTIRVCLGTACYVRGGKKVLDTIKKELKIEVGETTKDKLFSLEVGRCFGACGLAPVVLVNEDTHRRVKAHKIHELLDHYRNIYDQEHSEAGELNAGC